MSQARQQLFAGYGIVLELRWQGPVECLASWRVLPLFPTTSGATVFRVGNCSPPSIGARRISAINACLSWAAETPALRSSPSVQAGRCHLGKPRTTAFFTRGRRWPGVLRACHRKVESPAGGPRSRPAEEPAPLRLLHRAGHHLARWFTGSDRCRDLVYPFSSRARSLARPGCH